MKRFSLLLSLLFAALLAGGCATAVMSGGVSGRQDPADLEDARITREVRMLIYRDFRLGEQRIHVSTERGIVTLSGQIESRQDISRAMELVRGVEGVRGINLKLEEIR